MVYLPFLQSEFRGSRDTPASLEIRLVPGHNLDTGGLEPTIQAVAPGLAARGGAAHERPH